MVKHSTRRVARACRQGARRQARGSRLADDPATRADAIQAEIERRLAIAIRPRSRATSTRITQGVQRLLRLREGERGDPPDGDGDPQCRDARRRPGDFIGHIGRRLRVRHAADRVDAVCKGNLRAFRPADPACYTIRRIARRLHRDQGSVRRAALVPDHERVDPAIRWRARRRTPARQLAASASATAKAIRIRPSPDGRRCLRQSAR